MTPAYWQRIEEIFHRGITVDPAERDAWLAAECAGDAEIADAVRRLLDADAAGESTFHGVVAKAAGDLSHARPERIGPYRIVRELGAGGMGTVWLAARDDDEFHKLVAIKLLHAGMDRDRFRRERQILAELDHPWIARLLDGGTTPEGQLYLVMEYADGPTVTDWRRQSQPAIREICRVFQQVCQAVAHAHRNLIVHRDLKPANVLITSAGPKLLDFGIAKLLGPGQTDGRAGVTQAFFTPEYASPEQVSGGPITTATDVFALGAILQEMLTGRPFRQPKPLAEAIEAIRLGETPDTKGLPPDLAKIISQALAHDPAARYGSAESLGADVGRYLDGLPVEARGASPLYRAAKFARRHWLAFATAALMATALAGAAVYSFQQARRAEAQSRLAEAGRREALRQSARAGEAQAEAEKQTRVAQAALLTAQRRFDEAHAVNRKLLSDLYSAIENLPGATPARRLMIKTAIEGFDRLARDQKENAGLRWDLAQAYQKISVVQATTQDFAGAWISNEKAWALLRSVPGGTAEAEAAMVDVLTRRAMILRDQSQNEAALSAFARAIAYGGSAPPVRLSRAHAFRARAALKSQTGQYRDALADLRQSLALFESTPQADPLEAVDTRRLIGVAQFHLAEFDAALAASREALRVTGEAVARDPDNLTKLRRLMAGHVLASDVLMSTRFKGHDLEKALAEADQAVEVAERVARLDPADSLARFQWAQILHRGGIALMQRQRYPEALERLHRSRSLGAVLGDLEFLASLDYVIGMTHQRAKQYDEAEKAVRQSLASFLKLGNARRSVLTTVPSLHEVLGDIYATRGEKQQAREAFAESLRLFQHAARATDFVAAPHITRVEKKLAAQQ